MPDRAFYQGDSARMQGLRAGCQAHIAALLKQAGYRDAPARAARVFALEQQIAASHASREDSADVAKGNNAWRAADFASKAPGLDWKAFFQAAGLGTQTDFIVWHPTAMTGSAALAATNAALSDAVGKLYVERYFPPESKARVQDMVTNIVAAFSRRIDKLDWMAPATKAQAQEKLKTLYVGVGYPERWDDYAGLRVVRGGAPANPQGRPCAGAIPRRHRAQPRRLVSGIRRPAGAAAVPGAGTARARLVVISAAGRPARRQRKMRPSMTGPP